MSKFLVSDGGRLSRRPPSLIMAKHSGLVDDARKMACRWNSFAPQKRLKRLKRTNMRGHCRMMYPHCLGGNVRAHVSVGPWQKKVHEATESLSDLDLAKQRRVGLSLLTPETTPAEDANMPFAIYILALAAFVVGTSVICLGQGVGAGIGGVVVGSVGFAALGRVGAGIACVAWGAVMMVKTR